MAASASVPLPYTSAGLDGSGGCNRIVRSDTLAGSASTAAASPAVSRTPESCAPPAGGRGARAGPRATAGAAGPGWKGRPSPGAAGRRRAPGEKVWGGPRAPTRPAPPYPAHTKIVSYRRDGGPPIVEAHPWRDHH